MARLNRELKVWQFYTVDSEHRNTLLDEKLCKSPSRTKLWSDMQIMLDEKPHIESVGYCVKE